MVYDSIKLQEVPSRWCKRSSCMVSVSPLFPHGRLCFDETAFVFFLFCYHACRQPDAGRHTQTSMQDHRLQSTLEPRGDRVAVNQWDTSSEGEKKKIPCWVTCLMETVSSHRHAEGHCCTCNIMGKKPLLHAVHVGGKTNRRVNYFCTIAVSFGQLLSVQKCSQTLVSAGRRRLQAQE